MSTGDVVTKVRGSIPLSPFGLDVTGDTRLDGLFTSTVRFDRRSISGGRLSGCRSRRTRPPSRRDRRAWLRGGRRDQKDRPPFRHGNAVRIEPRGLNANRVKRCRSLCLCRSRRCHSATTMVSLGIAAFDQPDRRRRRRGHAERWGTPAGYFMLSQRRLRAALPVARPTVGKGPDRDRRWLKSCRSNGEVGSAYQEAR